MHPSMPATRLMPRCFAACALPASAKQQAGFAACSLPCTHDNPACTSANRNQQVQADDPRLSRWTLSTYQFNRQWEFSWLALNMTPLKYQKIHWRSVPGSVGGSLGSAVELQNRCADVLHASVPAALLAAGGCTAD